LIPPESEAANSISKAALDRPLISFRFEPIEFRLAPISLTATFALPPLCGLITLRNEEWRTIEPEPLTSRFESLCGQVGITLR